MIKVMRYVRIMLIIEQVNVYKRQMIALNQELDVVLLVIYLKEGTPGYDGGTCTPIFIAALFTIAKL
jgi:hypothetical protein